MHTLYQKSLLRTRLDELNIQVFYVHHQEHCYKKDEFTLIEFNLT